MQTEINATNTKLRPKILKTDIGRTGAWELMYISLKIWVKSFENCNYIPINQAFWYACLNSLFALYKFQWLFGCLNLSLPRQRDNVRDLVLTATGMQYQQVSYACDIFGCSMPFEKLDILRLFKFYTFYSFKMKQWTYQTQKIPHKQHHCGQQCNLINDFHLLE